MELALASGLRKSGTVGGDTGFTPSAKRSSMPCTPDLFRLPGI